MTYLISIDPGRATGIALGWFSEKAPYSLEEVWVTHDGPEGVADWWEMYRKRTSKYVRHSHRVVEDFTNDFSFADLDSVEVIGYLKGIRFRIDDYQSPSSKRHCPDQILKENGLWVTGSMVDHTDGRDANDAIIHGITNLVLRQHRPTLAKYFPDEY